MCVYVCVLDEVKGCMVGWGRRWCGWGWGRPGEAEKLQVGLGLGLLRQLSVHLGCLATHSARLLSCLLFGGHRRHSRVSPPPMPFTTTCHLFPYILFTKTIPYQNVVYTVFIQVLSFKTFHYVFMDKVRRLYSDLWMPLWPGDESKPSQFGSLWKRENLWFLYLLFPREVVSVRYIFAVFVFHRLCCSSSSELWK